jgi:hypothetical protein
LNWSLRCFPFHASLILTETAANGKRKVLNDKKKRIELFTSYSRTEENS